MVDVAAASAFVATHGRLLDRRRLGLLLGDEPPEGALAALAAYRNADGGYGWGLEPDLRAPGSQPAGALHALEVFEEIASATTPRAAEVCDWLDSVTLPDGGLPFALPGAESPGTAPWWAGGDPMESSLHLTTAICSYAHRVAAHDHTVAAHPWLRRATDYCRGAIAGLEAPRGTYELRYSLWFLDAAGDTAELERLARFVPETWERPVEGGVEGEQLGPLEFSPLPDRPLRRLVPEGVIERDLDRLARGQREDGGWEVEWSPSSPAASLEWRGYVTVRALRLLRANGRLTA